MENLNINRFTDTLNRGFSMMDNLNELPPDLIPYKDRITELIAAGDVEGLKKLKKELEILKNNSIVQK